MKYIVPSFLVVLLLSGCDWFSATPSPDSATPMPPAEQMQQDQEPEAMGMYRPYEEGVIGNGEAAVLFFHAQWCPNCREDDQRLQAVDKLGGIKRPIYKVDYDTETDLKQRYGVVTQHTYVVIDGEGNEVETYNGLSQANFQAVLGM